MSRKSKPQLSKESLRIQIRTRKDLRVAKISFAKVEDIQRAYRINAADTRQVEHLLHLMANQDRIDIRIGSGAQGQRPLLLWDERIAKVARSFSQSMSTNQTHHMAIPDGTTIHYRLSKRRIKWLSFGVNLGLSSGYPLAAHVAFMRGRSHHQNHRANILNPQFTRFGAGVAWSNGVFFVCEIFLQPAQK